MKETAGGNDVEEGRSKQWQRGGWSQGEKLRPRQEAKGGEAE
jgi:hypothetical protein